jgi:triacylglycerol lipase
MGALTASAMRSGRESSARPPLVLVHGLFDTPSVFDSLKRHLAGRRERLLLPALPLRFGIAPIQMSAQRLAGHIEAHEVASGPPIKLEVNALKF